MIAATAPGKIVVSGEYAVLEGYSALSIAVNRRAVSKKSRSLAASPFLIELGKRLKKREEDVPWPVHVDTDSMKWRGKKLGIGSSSACTVSAAKFALPEISERELFELCLSVHRQVQGGSGGSGVDVASAVYGAAIDYKIVSGRSEVNAAVIPDVHFVYLYAGEPQKTTKALATSSMLKKNFPKVHRDRMSQLGEVSEELLKTERPKDWIEMLAQAREAVLALQKDGKMAIEIDSHRRAALLAVECGGVAKSTGAGGGDMIIAAFEDRDQKSFFQRACPKNGLIQIDLSIDPHGAIIESD